MKIAIPDLISNLYFPPPRRSNAAYSGRKDVGLVTGLVPYEDVVAV